MVLCKPSHPSGKKMLFPPPIPYELVGLMNRTQPIPIFTELLMNYASTTGPYPRKKFFPSIDTTWASPMISLWMAGFHPTPTVPVFPPQPIDPAIWDRPSPSMQPGTLWSCRIYRHRTGGRCPSGSNPNSTPTSTSPHSIFLPSSN